MAITGKRIILQNNQALRAKDQNGDVQELVKIDASGELAGKVPEAIALKAAQSDLDAAELRIDSVETDLAGKASQSALDQEILDRESGDADALQDAKNYTDAEIAAISVPDEVQFYDDLAAFPAVGDQSAIYADKDTNKLYRFKEVIVPGSFDHVVGPTGDFATLQDALASPSVLDGHSIQVQAGTYLVSSTLTIAKQVKIFGAGYDHTIYESAGTSSDPVTMISVTADNVVLSGIAFKHKKTSNTSVETAVSVSGTSFPQTRVANFIMDTCRIEHIEFGLVLRGSNWKVANTQFVYKGPNNSTRRHVGIYGFSGDCFARYNTSSEDIAPGVTGNTRWFNITSTTGTNPNETCEGKLILEANVQVSGNLQQFLSQDNWQGSAGSYELAANLNSTQETSAFVSFYGTSANFGNILSQVTITNNSISNLHGGTPAGGKGLIGIDGAGGVAFRSSALAVHQSGNTLSNLVFRTDYEEVAGSSGALVGKSSVNIGAASVSMDSSIPSLPNPPDTPSGGSEEITQEYVELSSAGDLSAIESAIDDLESDVSDLQSDMALKASQADLDALELRVDGAESDIDGLELSVAGKASQADLDALELRVDSAESDIDTLESDVDAVESALAGKLDASEKGAVNGVAELDATGKVPTAQLPSLQSVEAVKMSAITLTAQQVLDGYLNLTHEAMANSISVFCERVAILQGLDYSVSVVGGVSRLTWIGPSAAGAEEEFAEGDIVYIQYLRQL